MTPPPWLARLDATDASLPLALAALVQAADAEGRAPLADVLLGYREAFLRLYQPAGGLGESVRDHVTASVLPRLAPGDGKEVLPIKFLPVISRSRQGAES